MRHDQLVKEKRAEILRIASRHGARDIRIFGSIESADEFVSALRGWRHDDGPEPDAPRAS